MNEKLPRYLRICRELEIAQNAKSCSKYKKLPKNCLGKALLVTAPPAFQSLLRQVRSSDVPFAVTSTPRPPADHKKVWLFLM